MDSLTATVKTFEKIEQVRVSESVRAAHLLKRVRCVTCDRHWVPAQPRERKGEKDPDRPAPLDRTVCPVCGRAEESVPDPTKHPFLTDTVLPELERIEALVEAEIIRLVEALPAWRQWGKRVKGLGPTSFGYVWGKCDWIRLPTASSMLAHSGLAHKNGQIQRRRKGQKIDYDPQLQSRTCIIGECLLRAKGTYYEFYRKEKAQVLGNGWAKDLGHAHNHSFRLMRQICMSHFWETARKSLDLLAPLPYAFGVLGHGGYIAPEEMCDKGPLAK